MRWTGNGLVDGTAITTGNQNTTGNGDAVTFQTSGTGNMVTAADGVDIWANDGSIRRLDATLSTPAKGAKWQLEFTLNQVPTVAAQRLVEVRSSSSARAASFVLNLAGKINPRRSDNTDPGNGIESPALVVGHKYRFDFLVLLSQTATPSTTNGRVVLRVLDLTDSAWGASGSWYYDSGYTFNVGTADITLFFMGHMGGAVASTTPNRFEQFGWDSLTENMTAVTNRADVEQRFMPAPVASGGNAAPSATVGAGTPATATQNSVVPLRGTVADSDGSATGLWSITTWPGTMSGPPTIANPTSLTNASFTAVAPGDYNVRLTATDNLGATGVANKAVTVTQATGTVLKGPKRWNGTAWVRD